MTIHRKRKRPKGLLRGKGWQVSQFWTDGDIPQEEERDAALPLRAEAERLEADRQDVAWVVAPIIEGAGLGEGGEEGVRSRRLSP